MTELTWEGKYKEGKKVAPIRIALPFQTIETVNESGQQRQKALDFFAAGQPTEWRNRLIWGDKKYVLPSLLPEFAGKVNLIYIDPPFDTGANFSFTASIAPSPDGEGEGGEATQFTKEPNVIEQKAYRDTWGRGLESYLQWFYETAILLRELLAENGSIYVHLDWHVGHYAKAVMDEVFGYENFRNEIFVKRVKKNVQERELVKSLNVAVDSVLFYSKSEQTKLKPPMKPEYRQDRWHSFEAAGYRGGMDYELFGKKPKNNNHWRWTKEKAEQAIKEKRLRAHPKTGQPEYFIDASDETLCDSLWDDFQAYSFKYSYPTEKNEYLLERILQMSSNEGDLVLDCFCGSGTTAAVAEKLNRRWITCDLGRFAIHTARKRFLQIENVKPFIVQNLGKYERQQWLKAEFSPAQTLPNGEGLISRMEQEKAYRNFIIDLYHAQPLSGYIWLHGAKAGRMVHIGSVDAPVSNGDVKSIVQEFWKSVGKSYSPSPLGEGQGVRRNGIDILGWDFAFELNETAKQYAQANKVDLKFKLIPKEVLEKKAVEQGDIRFFELAYLDIKTKKEKKKITLSLENFIVPPDDIPQEVLGKISHWSQWVDYWAVDWDFKDDTFHNQWQSYRTKQNSKLELTASNSYEKPGKFTVVVKVIDILGNDTTKAINIQI